MRLFVYWKKKNQDGSELWTGTVRDTVGAYVLHCYCFYLACLRLFASFFSFAVQEATGVQFALRYAMLRYTTLRFVSYGFSYFYFYLTMRIA